MKKLIFTALAALTVSAPAVADKWRLFGGEENLVLFANLSSLDCNSGICSLWVSEINVDKAKKYDSAMFFYEVKCRSKVLRLSYFSLYLDGKTIDSRSTTNEYTPVIPESHGQDLFNIACGKETTQDGLNINILSEVERFQEFLRGEWWKNQFKGK